MLCACIMPFLCTGNFQSRFIPGLIGPFLKVSLLPHPGKTYYPYNNLKHNDY